MSGMSTSSRVEWVIRDVRYALRMLRKTPGFTAIALATLTLGIGVNTAVFSVVNGLLLQPLPYAEPDRLATIRVAVKGTRGDGVRQMSIDGATFLALRDNAQLIDVAVRGSSGWGGGVNFVAGNQAANVPQSRVSAGYFRVLGIRPLFGRDFSADDDRAGSAPVAILSRDLWARVFNSDPAAIGQSIMLRGEPYTVIGVMPRGSVDDEPFGLWTPLRPARTGEGGGTNYGLIARLRSGVDWTQASAEVDQIATPVLRPQLGRNVTSAISTLIPLQTATTSDIRDALLRLWAAVGVVLVIACVNIAGLLIARSSARTREIATRIALGSGRAVVIRQLLVESVILALAGGLAGAALGWLLLESLRTMSVELVSTGIPIGLDARVLAVTLGTAVVTSIAFGLVPALHASRVNVLGSLAESGSRSVAGGRGRWPRRVLVVAEVALGVVLLVGAGLLVRTFLELKGLSPGFDPENVVTATVSLQDARYREPEKVSRLFADTLERIRRQPGVTAAGVTLGLPYTRLLNLGFKPLDGGVDPGKPMIANVSYVTPGYFEALRVQVREGRNFTDADQAASTPVAIVNDEFVRRYYDDKQAIGRHLSVVGAREIVGVVGNTRTTTSGFQGYSDPLVTPPIIYVPASQLTAGTINLVHTWFAPAWVVKAAGPVDGIGAGIRDAIAAVDPLLPVSKLESMSRVQAASLAGQRFMAALVAGLGIVALILAAVGIHGLISSSVTERTRELGIRLALGGSNLQVMRAVVLPGVILGAVGVTIGSAAALAASETMRAFVWGIAPTDPFTFAMVAAILLAVALAASVIPALRVLRLDPAVTLRAE
jgi:predicted permease